MTQSRCRAVPRKPIVDGPKGAASEERAKQGTALQQVFRQALPRRSCVAWLILNQLRKQRSQGHDHRSGVRETIDRFVRKIEDGLKGMHGSGLFLEMEKVP